MKKLLIAGLAVLLISGGPALADDRAERLQVAHEYIQATIADMDLDAIIKQMWTPVVVQLAKQGKKLTDKQIGEIDALYKETFHGPLLDIMQAQDEIMADLLTLDEIKALRDFYQTKEGRSVMQKMPLVMSKQQPMIMKLMQTTLPKILPKIQDIVTH